MTAPCTGVIIAGGRSTRFDGRPKGLELVGGIRILDRVAAALADACDKVIMIANDPAAVEWLPDTPVHADIIENAGALGGIHAALGHSGTAVVVVAWDMPFVPGELLRDLRSAGSDADAVLPMSGNWRGLEPLCAFYSQACLDPIERALAAGDKRAIAFHDSIRLRVLSYAEVARHGDPGVMFMNVNNASDLREAGEIEVQMHDQRKPDD
jgi:molybdopterin-guanine dinucleotide biosynthesis protein A